MLLLSDIPAIADSGGVQFVGQRGHLLGQRSLDFAVQLTYKKKIIIIKIKNKKGKKDFTLQFSSCDSYVYCV